MVYYIYVSTDETSSEQSSINETNIDGWSGLSNIRTQNAVCAYGATASDMTCRFDFNIPTNAIILGIEIKLLCVSSVSDKVVGAKVRSGTSGDWSDEQFKDIGYSGGIECTNLSWVSIGGSTDLWGLNWTPVDINTVTRDNIYIHGIAGTGNVRLDHAIVKVYYIADFYPPSKVFFTRPLGEVGYGYMIIPSKDVDFSTYYNTQEQEITIVDINGKKLFHGMITTPHAETDGVRIDFKGITQQLVDRKCKRNYVLEKGTVSEVSS